MSVHLNFPASKATGIVHLRSEERYPPRSKLDEKIFNIDAYLADTIVPPSPLQIRSQEHQSRSRPCVKILFIRHGDTEWSDRRLIQGHQDVPLNSRGLEQAGQTAQHLAHRTFDRIYLSPMRRVGQTVEKILEKQKSYRVGHGLGVYPTQIIEDRRLLGQKMGSLTGQPYDRVDFVHDPSSADRFEGVEKYSEFERRVMNFGASMLGTEVHAARMSYSCSSHTLIAGHGVPLRILLANILQAGGWSRARVDTVLPLFYPVNRVSELVIHDVYRLPLEDGAMDWDATQSNPIHLSFSFI